jgi:NADH pyrophosphatase NudC (nudix superfamily)
MLHSEYDLTGATFTFGLDNDSARIAIMSDYEPSVKKPDYDIIYDIRRRMEKLPITFLSKWIESHQDKGNADYSTMDIWTLLNIEMDHDAGAFRAQHTNSKRPNLPFTNEKTTIWIDNRKLAHFDKHELYSIVHGRANHHLTDKKTWSCKQYWQTRENISDECIERVHWHALGKAFRKYPGGKQRWLVKHSTGQCGVGRMHLRRKYREHSQCPRCGQEDESTQHVLQCKSLSADIQWKIRIKTLEMWLTNNFTPSYLQGAILQRLCEWRNDTPFARIYGPGNIQQVIAHQDNIGWWSFLLGRVDESFESCMNEHFAAKGMRNTGRPWLSKLITQLWDLQFNMWEHRNEIEHSDMTPDKLKQLDLLRIKATEELNEGCSTLSQQDKTLFLNPALISNLNLTDLKQWLKDVHLARQAANNDLVQRRRALTRARNFMRDWLNRANTQD